MSIWELFKSTKRFEDANDLKAKIKELEAENENIKQRDDSVIAHLANGLSETHNEYMLKENQKLREVIKELLKMAENNAIGSYTRENHLIKIRKKLEGLK